MLSVKTYIASMISLLVISCLWYLSAVRLQDVWLSRIWESFRSTSQGGGGGEGGQKTRQIFVSESSNKNWRHFRSNWRPAACFGEVERWRLGQAWFLRIFEPSVSGIVNCGYERCFKDIASTFCARVFQISAFFYCFDGKYETGKRRVMAKIPHSQNEWGSDFWLLRLLIVRKLKL